jgi:hypothetical protein
MSAPEMGIRHALSMKMAQNTAEMAQLSSAIPHRAIHKPFPYGQSQIRYLFSVALVPFQAQQSLT